MWSRAVEVRPHKPGLWRSSYVSYAPSYKGKVYSELVPKVVTFQLLSLHYTNPPHGSLLLCGDCGPN